jgi:hypothetical protein
MAAPEGVTPIYNNVVVSVYSGGGFWYNCSYTADSSWHSL